MTKPNYTKIAQKYCADILSGKIPACKTVIQACRRQVDDLERFSGDDAPFRFDVRSASTICWFIENLTHVKGELAGEKIHLEPWQVFILTTAFGWITREGGRRYRRAYIEVPRGNGKSCLSSGVALYGLCADKEQGAEVYSFATTRDQAKIVFGDAKQMASVNKPLQKFFGLSVLANALYIEKTASTFQAKSAEGSTLDGLNTHIAVVDELHAHKTRAVYDVVETSLGKRKNSLMWVITTAGFDLSGICYEVRSHVCRVLDGTSSDESQFGIIYGLDQDDDWTSDASLEKANSNWGVSVRPEVIRSLHLKAQSVASAANNFMTKHLNRWCNANSAWMNMTDLAKCVDDKLSQADFEGEECWIGLDLASRVDIAAAVKVFVRQIDGRDHYFAFGDYWLPKRTIETSSNSQYAGWEHTGDMHVTEGASINFGAIEERLLDDCSRFSVVEVPYDPFQATQLSTRMEEQGVPMVECRQTVANFSDPMKALEASVRDGTFHYNGDPVLTWMFSNVVCHVDAKDNVFPRKDRPENKIDGVVALIMAFSRAMAARREDYDLDSFLDSGVVVRF